MNRIDDQRERRSRCEPIEHRAQIRLGIDEQRASSLAQRAIRAQLDLRGRLLAADVDDFAVSRQARRDLQQQRRFAGAGRSADERQASGNDAAAEHRVELRHSDAQRARRRADPISCSATGSARLPRLGARARPRAATVNGRSSNEFHASHCGQRPSQRGDSKPQAEQK